MKNILNSLKVNPLVYFLLFLACTTGEIKRFLIILLIILTHEIGHILVAKFYKYKIIKIELMPFGGTTTLDKDINSPLKEEIILASAGVFMQGLLFLIMNLFWHLGLIRDYIYEMFFLYNETIFIFNLLPIIPLDGYILLKSIIEYWTSFKLAFIITNIISILGIIIFITFNILMDLNNILIITFLVYKLFIFIKRWRYVQNRFYLERLIKEYNFKKIKIIEGLKPTKMAKEKRHFFLVNKKLNKEKEVLQDRFDTRVKF